MKTDYEDQIYRPGEDVGKLADLSEDEKSERRQEIESIFADPDTYEVEQRRRMEEADNA